jgi:nicotinate-nucleotide pyrophosphorylase (carboxylating)
LIPFPLSDARRLIEAALAEDVGIGDVTTLATVPENRLAVADLVAKETFLLAGLDGFRLAFEVLNPSARIDWAENFRDGDEVEKGAVIISMTGDARTILTGERTALNLLQRLCGVATQTSRWVKLLEGTSVKLLDTRKTTPGLRALEKYGVRVGGGRNHRFGLFDGILIKENHIRAAGSIRAAVEAARAYAPHTLKVEVEVANLAELSEAMEAGAEIALLDNMSDQMMKEAVALASGRVLLEASGNMSEERLPGVAATGVDFISAGALTHSVRAVDISLLFRLS